MSDLSAKLVRLGHRLAVAPIDGTPSATEATRFAAGLLVLTGVLVELADMAPHGASFYQM